MSCNKQLFWLWFECSIHPHQTMHSKARKVILNNTSNYNIWNKKLSQRLRRLQCIEKYHFCHFKHVKSNIPFLAHLLRKAYISFTRGRWRSMCCAERVYASVQSQRCSSMVNKNGEYQKYLFGFCSVLVIMLKVYPCIIFPFNLHRYSQIVITIIIIDIPPLTLRCIFFGPNCVEVYLLFHTESYIIFLVGWQKTFM